jgi:hypothetical protein
MIDHTMRPALTLPRAPVHIDWRRVLLVALMVLPFALAYTVRLTGRALGWALAWLWAAALEGWACAGPRGSGGPP